MNDLSRKLNQNNGTAHNPAGDDFPNIKPDASAIFGPVVKAEASCYSRERDLPRVLTVWKHELEDFSLEGIAYIVSRLEEKSVAPARPL